MENIQFYKKIQLATTKIFAAILLFSSVLTGCFETSTEIPITMHVSASSLNFDSSGENKSLVIVSNTNNWTVGSDASWLTISPTSGMGDEIIILSASQNTGTTERTATLTVSGTGFNTQHINVTQSGPPPSVFGNNIVASSSFGGGNGSQGSPYLIYNAEQLKKLANDVNNENRNYANTYFKLMTNIEVTATEWIPIANYTNSTSFRGIFDGNDCIVSGTLRSNRYNYFGFFGRLGESAQVINLTISAIVRNDRTFLEKDGYVRTGSIAGVSSGSNVIIRNCLFTGSLTGGISNYSFTGGIVGGFYDNSSIRDCTVSGIIIGGKADGSTGTSVTGGIAGLLIDSEVSNCTVFNSAKITGGDTDDFNWSKTGGIAGENQGSIIGCTNHADVSGRGSNGGIVGDNYETLHTSLNTGNISDNTGFDDFSGGLAGLNSDRYDVHIYSCCTNQGTVNGQPANTANQIGYGKEVETCPNGHTKR